jgi:hypothetical protein
MSIITESERDYLLNSMKNLLSHYDYLYTDEALDDIITEWSKQKEVLIAAFKNHPKYLDGKFMIAFESNYERPINVGVSRDFGNWIVGRCCTEEYTNQLPEEINNQRIEEGCKFLPDKLFMFFYREISDYADRTVSADRAAKINEIIPNIKAKEGEKPAVSSTDCAHILGTTNILIISANLQSTQIP